MRTLPPIVAVTLFLGGLGQFPAQANTPVPCEAPSLLETSLLNQAHYSYGDPQQQSFTGVSNSIANAIVSSGVLNITAQGIRDRDGNLIYGLGTVATAIHHDLLAVGLSEEDALTGSVAAVRALVSLSPNASVAEAIATIKSAMIAALPDAAALNQIEDQTLTLDVIGLSSVSLQSLGLTLTEQQTAQAAANSAITAGGTATFSQRAQTAFDAAIAAVPTQATLLSSAKNSLVNELAQVRTKTDVSPKAGDTMRFEFVLRNQGNAPMSVELPSVAAIQQSGLTGTATVTATSFEGMATPTAPIELQPNQQIKLLVDTQVSQVPAQGTTLAIGLGGSCGSGPMAVQQSVLLLPAITPPLVDPFGRITGCAGETLPSYRGFSVALYRPAGNTGDVAGLLPLPATELPDQPNNAIPAGLEPNNENSNPFFLANSDDGRYNFLLSRNQLKSGDVYILVIKPPEDSGYDERRVRITVGDRTAEGYSYRATSLDGLPITSDNNRTNVTGTLRISDAATTGLVLALIDIDTSVCQSQAIQIIKTGDRATAEPGDTVIYRLLVRNLSTTAIDRLAIADTLPLGFTFVDDSVRGAIRDRPVAITTSREGSTISLQLQTALPKDGTLTIAYAAQLTPDAIRGTGENVAIARGQRDDNDWTVRDGPAIHRLRVQPGIVADCGTILGRVFVDKNFDGEQQNGEPGVADAVIYLDDGNRITTDANGLFSVANVLPGYRTGALDLTSIPDYTLAPNTRFIERNSSSRLVQLEPGGLVRMNFAVTPTAQSEENGHGQ